MNMYYVYYLFLLTKGKKVFSMINVIVWNIFYNTFFLKLLRFFYTNGSFGMSQLENDMNRDMKMLRVATCEIFRYVHLACLLQNRIYYSFRSRNFEMEKETKHKTPPTPTIRPKKEREFTPILLMFICKLQTSSYYSYVCVTTRILLKN